MAARLFLHRALQNYSAIVRKRASGSRPPSCPRACHFVPGSAVWRCALLCLPASKGSVGRD